MDIKTNTNFNAFGTQLKIENNTLTNNNDPIKLSGISSLVKNDTLSLNPLMSKSQQLNPVSFTTTPHNSSINQKIMDFYIKYDKDPSYKPIIDKAQDCIKNNSSMKDLEKNVINFTLESNPKMSHQEALSKAYKSIVVSLIKNPSYSDPKFFNGETDKLLHFFTSASISTNISKSIPVLPNNIKSNISGSIMTAVGFFKEVKDITGSGFNKHDIEANIKGITSAKENISKLDKFGKL